MKAVARFSAAVDARSDGARRGVEGMERYRLAQEYGLSLKALWLATKGDASLRDIADVYDALVRKERYLADFARDLSSAEVAAEVAAELALHAQIEAMCRGALASVEVRL